MGHVATAVATREGVVAPLPVMSDGEIDRVWRLANAFYKSGTFPMERAEEAFAKILLGRDLGLSPARSITAINIIDGRAEVSAQTLASFVRSREGYDYKVLHSDAERALIEFFDPGGSRGTSEFTIEDAQRAELLTEKKKNWRRYPKDMLFWRAMSRGVRQLLPEVTSGIPIYLEGEISTEADVELTPDDVEPITSDVVLPPAVEQVLARASALGYAPLADRGTAEMIVGGQPEEFVREQVGEWNAELDAHARTLGDPGEPESVEAMREHAADLRAEANTLRADSDDAAVLDTADMLEDQAKQITAHADSLATKEDAE